MGPLELTDDNLAALDVTVRELGYLGVRDWVFKDGIDKVPQLLVIAVHPEARENIMFSIGYLVGLAEALNLTMLEVLDCSTWSDEDL